MNGILAFIRLKAAGIFIPQVWVWDTLVDGDVARRLLPNGSYEYRPLSSAEQFDYSYSRMGW